MPAVVQYLIIALVAREISSMLRAAQRIRNGEGPLLVITQNRCCPCGAFRSTPLAVSAQGVDFWEHASGVAATRHRHDACIRPLLWGKSH